MGTRDTDQETSRNQGNEDRVSDKLLFWTLLNFKRSNKKKSFFTHRMEHEKKNHVLANQSQRRKIDREAKE